MFGTCRGKVGDAFAIALMVFGWTGGAVGQTFSEFPLATPGATPLGIAAGSDGALWFTEYVPGNGTAVPAASKIGRIAANGTIREFALPSDASAPDGIVAGPDGALWFVETGSQKIGRITTDGAISEFAIPFPTNAIPQAGTITMGSDGALWFPEGYIRAVGVGAGTAVIGRIATDGTVTSFTIDQGGIPFAIAAGSDGALWFLGSACCGVHYAGLFHLTTDGIGKSVTSSSLSLDGITAGPDGALWLGGEEAITRVSISGNVRTFNGQSGTGIATGPDGAIWFGQGIDLTNPTGAIGRITTTGTTTSFPLPAPTAPVNTSANPVMGIIAGPDAAMWFTLAPVSGESTVGSIGRVTTPANTSPLVASVLPDSRSVQANATATAFATLINSGNTDATGCALALVNSVAASFQYQTTNPATNALTGTPNIPVTIPAGGSQSFSFALTTNAPFVPTDSVIGFDCTNTDAATSISGLDTLLVSASTTPVPDIVSVNATPSGDGVLDIAGSSAAFAIATSNVGGGGAVMLAADTGGVTLPLTLTVCQTNPANGQCLAAPAPSLQVTADAAATGTFSIFATAGGSIPFVPQFNRIFVRFRDTAGEVRGLTSVAVRTQ